PIPLTPTPRSATSLLPVGPRCCTSYPLRPPAALFRYTHDAIFIHLKHRFQRARPSILWPVLSMRRCKIGNVLSAVLVYQRLLSRRVYAPDAHLSMPPFENSEETDMRSIDPFSIEPLESRTHMSATPTGMTPSQIRHAYGVDKIQFASGNKSIP